MKGTSPSRARREADTGNECHDGKCRSLIINPFGRGSPWPFCTPESISPRTSLPCTVSPPEAPSSCASPRSLAPACTNSSPHYRRAPSASKPAQVAHRWSRLFAAHGHSVKLMASKLVAPYRMSGKRGKNDAADAAAICEAVQRPNMRYVPVKTVDQPSRQLEII